MTQQDKCTITVNGVEVEARPGQMLIEVTDAVGAYVPRFCYHPKLTIAANCRMCLVEVENAPKPMPACATPVTPGMKVHTRSQKAVGAQRATMEFLLINHPLDCPICDQGGECELQDLAMGFGRDISRYTERKRVVRDKDIGPLVSTDMTRCIHCTRCVRFTQEVAGYQELGTIGRGDRVEIAPYIEQTVSHELSGNIIDLCPVGALNSKPYRFSARAWEMTQRPSVAPHDCLGSHVYAHVMDGRVKRVVPRPCEELNETWLSDRDRFSYEGIYAQDRPQQPMLREDGQWRALSWDEALDTAARRLRDAGGDVAALISPGATVEEGFLLARIMAHLGSSDIDHRLRQRDFRGQSAAAVAPGLGVTVAEVETLDEILVIGSDLRAEVPLLAHRVRKAAGRGAGVHFVNPSRFPYLFPVTTYLEGRPADFWHELGALVRAALGDTAPGTRAVATALEGAPAPSDVHRQLVARLGAAARTALVIGQLALRHPRLAEIEVLAAELGRLTRSTIGCLPEGPNAAGLALAGCLPHREAGGRPRARPGRSAAEIVASRPACLLLFGAEPGADCPEPAGAGFTIALSPFAGETLRRDADLVLPIGTFAETAGTFVNVEGRWQTFEAVARAVGESRPGWKVLRVLGNRLGAAQFDYATPEAVLDAARAAAGQPSRVDPLAELAASSQQAIGLADLDVPMYRVDALVRRAPALQQAAGAGLKLPETRRRSA
jgi:NADH-quinone oxidoreductase subunit G